MPQNTRLSLKEKVQAVEECLSGRVSLRSCSKRIGIGDATLSSWIRIYKVRGIEGLIPATTNRKYSNETKIRAVQEYLSGAGSLFDLCSKYDISHHRILQKWIMLYNSHGYFNHPNIGGMDHMVKGRKTTLDERIEIVSHCIANNKNYSKTIEQYSVSYGQIYGWVRKYEDNGADGLIDQRGKRKNDATMNEVEKLHAQLKLQKAENFRLQMENELLKKLEALERGRDAD